jgi:hypothetical protein
MDDQERLSKADKILNEVLLLVKSNKKPEALDLIRDTLDLKRTQSYTWLKKILDKVNEFNDQEIPIISNEKDLEFKKKYVFNRDTDQYVFLTDKKFGKNIVLESSLVKSLIIEYSNYDDDEQTGPDLSKKFGIPEKVLKEVFAILEFKHDSFPVLNEELHEGADQDKLIDDLLTAKKFNIYQNYQKKDWIETQDKAKKWEHFLQGQLHPLKDLLNTWKPPVISSLKNEPHTFDEKETVLIGLSDLHYGLYAEADGLFFSDKGWTIEDTKRVVQEYAEAIIAKLKKRSSNLPKKVVICLMGDLIHTLTGETDKGTHLEAHPIGEKQLDFAFESLFIFVSSIASVFEEVEIKAVNGNHAYLGDYTIGKMLEVTLGKSKKFSFDLSTSRFLAFTIGNNGFVMDHGASSHTKSKLPTQKTPRSNYAQTVFLYSKEVRNSDHRYYLVGDQHHLEHHEFNNFELIMFGTPSGGDRYADASVLVSRPRQSCLIFTDEGLSEVLHFYFD